MILLPEYATHQIYTYLDTLQKLYKNKNRNNECKLYTSLS